MWHHEAGQIERCDECRFDGSAYTDLDAGNTVRKLSAWAGELMLGVPPESLARRPTPTTWSPAEYLRHVKRMVWSMALLAETVLTEPGVAVEGSPPVDAAADDPAPEIDAAHELVRLHEESMRLFDLWTRCSDDRRDATIFVNGEAADLGGIVRHAAHDGSHHLSDIGRGIAALGYGSSGRGEVAFVHASNGGVPKRTLGRAVVGYRGIVGDRQDDRRNHGRVWQALCLWSTEVIDRLRSEGHPVAPGTAGENLTLSGIDWSALRPGTRLDFADGGPLVETTMWAAPCKTIAESFTERDFRRIDAVRQPGSARLYAKVLRDGVVRPGQAFTLS